MPERGRAAEEVLGELRARRRQDVDYEDGKLFAYVFLPDPQARRVAERAYSEYLWSNALDPLVFPSLLRMEQEIVAMAADHLHAPEGASGNVTSGGTESVLLAVRTARDWARATRPGVDRPQMVLPVTAHPCFHKGAQYFGLDVVTTPVDPKTLRASVDAMRAAVTERTALVVGSAPSYAHGVVDPIGPIAALARERGILCHVDGCIGAFMLPLFRELGAEVPPFDFEVPGVTSMSMDLHKYALTPKGASVLLYRDADLHRLQLFCHSAWTGYPVINATIQSSKNGGPVAAAWALLQCMGRQGYLEVARGLRQGARKVRSGVGQIEGLRVLGDPEMSLVAVTGDGLDIFVLSDAMKRRGWDMHCQLRLGDVPESFHMTVMPGNLPHLDAWLADLKDAVAEVGSAKAGGKLAAVGEMLAQADLSTLRGNDVQALLDSVGLEGGDALSAALGEVNALLNELEPPQRDAILAAFYEYLLHQARTP